MHDDLLGTTVMAILITALVSIVVGGLAWCVAWGDRCFHDDDEDGYVVQPAVVGWSASRNALPPEKAEQLKAVVERMFR